MKTQAKNNGRRAAFGTLALTLVSGCGLPGHAPKRSAPAPRDVVSVGYGTQSREDIAVPISSVSAERAGNITRIEDLLDAIPGLEILPLPNGDFTVRIRGTGAGAGSAEPLLVIDDAQVPTGTIGTTLASIPLRDIVRIDVLKDVAATAVYGTRGANGVIIVTTRW